MYEDYYTPIPDLSLTFSRLCLSEADFQPDLSHLDQLIDAFQTHIPFEDLDSAWLNHPIDLSIPALYDKLIVRKRGGFCFELNGFLERMLKDVGYSCCSVFCRIIQGRDFIPACTHRGVIVTLDGMPHYCDVGFGGPQPAASVPVTDGAEVQTCSGRFRMEKAADGWWTLSHRKSEKQWEPVLQFTLTPQTPVEFIPVSYYCSTNPSSLFVQKRIVNLRTADGFRSMTDNRYTVHEDQSEKVRIIDSESEYRQILRQDFGINL